MATAALQILVGRATDPNLFGWNLEEWGSVLNLTFHDTAGLALTDALHPGVLRYPGGTNSNIWDMVKGEYVNPLPAASGYQRYREFEPWISGLPAGTFSGGSFLDGLGGRAKRVLWVLNVYTMNASAACEQIRYISSLPGQQQPGVWLELGNELYSDSQGMPAFPNSTVYAQKMVPIIACTRKLMPAAKIAIMRQGTGSWDIPLRPFVHLVDGATLHDYSPSTGAADKHPAEERISYLAGYPRARLKQAISTQESYLNASVPILLTEFGYGLDAPPNCMLGESMIFGALHGAFHAARVLAAINEPAGAVGALTSETFVFRDPGDEDRPSCKGKCKDDWCGMAAGTCHQDAPNRPDLARITGRGQLVAHLFARAVASDSMHPVNVSDEPALRAPFNILGESQPCLQAGAFSAAGDGGAGAMAVAVLNICNHSIEASVEAPPVTGTSGGAFAKARVTSYDLADEGGKAGLPSDPDAFPWPAPLAARSTDAALDALTLAALSFSIVDISG